MKVLRGGLPFALFAAPLELLLRWLLGAAVVLAGVAGAAGVAWGRWRR